MQSGHESRALEGPPLRILLGALLLETLLEGPLEGVLEGPLREAPPLLEDGPPLLLEGVLEGPLLESVPLPAASRRPCPVAKSPGVVHAEVGSTTSSGNS